MTHYYTHIYNTVLYLLLLTQMDLSLTLQFYFSNSQNIWGQKSKQSEFFKRWFWQLNALTNNDFTSHHQYMYLYTIIRKLTGSSSLLDHTPGTKRSFITCRMLSRGGSARHPAWILRGRKGKVISHNIH